MIPSIHFECWLLLTTTWVIWRRMKYVIDSFQSFEEICSIAEGKKGLAATQTPGETGKRWFQGTADAVRQFHWLFEVAGCMSSPVIGHKSSMQAKDSHVKLRIKSFKVPELFIEIPEMATVGFLKRTVMDAVTALFGGALRVGVLLHGKKIRDDNITLLQTGISCDDKVENLGFTLEPTTIHPPLSQSSEDARCLLPCDSTQPVTRNALVLASDPGVFEAFPNSPMTNSGNSTESNHDSVSFPTDTSPKKSTLDSKALVAIPTMSLEALAMVPLHRKSKQSEVVQRRMRRPFSVFRS